MKHSPVSLPLAFVVLALVPALAGPVHGGVNLVKPTKEWSGAFPTNKDIGLLQQAPRQGFVPDAEQFAKLWKAWRSGEKVPAVDFAKELVFAHAATGPNFIKMTFRLDESENLRTDFGSTKRGGPGFAYKIVTVPRAGVKTLNGKPIPAADEGPATGPGGAAGKLEDGIYIWVADGPGTRVTRNDGAQVVLVRRISGAFGKAAMWSVANDNARFQLSLKNVGPVKKEVEGGAPLAVVVDGVCLAAFGQSDLHADGTLDLGLMLQGEQAAEKVAARLKVKPELRKHPGHRFLVRWTPDKESYPVGEAVTLKLEIRNVGKVPFTFRVGGQQRGPRDNQFRFLAYRSHGQGRAVHDIGDPVNFGGISSNRTLKPGEAFTHTVGLDKWFTFLEPDIYRVTGLYALEMYDPNDQGSFGRVIWSDYATGDCVVRVMPKE